MRTTLRIEDDLLQELKRLARKENIPVTRLINRMLSTSLRSSQNTKSPKRPYREKTYDLGKPTINLDKALMIAAEMENQEIIRKLELRK